mgnify:CR=1 FL=1
MGTERPSFGEDEPLSVYWAPKKGTYMSHNCECPCLARCPFFNETMVEMPATAQMYKTRYCSGNQARCARYLVFRKLGKGNVPRNLHPNQIRRAQFLIEQKPSSQAA